MPATRRDAQLLKEETKIFNYRVSNKFHARIVRYARAHGFTLQGASLALLNEGLTAWEEHERAEQLERVEYGDVNTIAAPTHDFADQYDRTALRQQMKHEEDNDGDE